MKRRFDTKARSKTESRAKRAGAAGQENAPKMRRESPSAAPDARKNATRQENQQHRENKHQPGRQHQDGAHQERQQQEREPNRIEQSHAVNQLYGINPVLERLRAGTRRIERILVAEHRHEHRLRELLSLARAQNVVVRVCPRAELDRLTMGEANHQGVVALTAAAAYADEQALLDSLAENARRSDPESAPLVLALDGVEDPRNLGAIARTAECAGAHGIFVPERRAAGLTDTAAKAAAGALEYLPVARTQNFARLIEELKERGVWTIGAEMNATVDYTEWDWTLPVAIFLGGEAKGLRRLVRERLDKLVRIPLRGKTESLNVSVAAGVLLFEAARQRSQAKSDESERAENKLD